MIYQNANGDREKRGRLSFIAEHLQRETGDGPRVNCCWTCLVKSEEEDSGEKGRQQLKADEGEKQKDRRREGWSVRAYVGGVENKKLWQPSMSTSWFNKSKTAQREKTHKRDQRL